MRDGQTNAVDRDAVAESDVFEHLRRAYGNLAARQAIERADFFNDSRKQRLPRPLRHIAREEQIVAVAQAVKASGANILRGGAFKPRTSPYDFQGLKATGIELLKTARAATGLPIVTEIMGVEHLPLFEDVDIIQVGARNMQNFDLLRELGKLRKPILLKRGLASTLKELLMSAEYIMAGGNEQVILCERGIRTFDDYTRNTLDLAAVPMLKELTHLPVIVDPSHAARQAG